MFNRKWKQAQGKFHDTQNKISKSNRNQKKEDGMISAQKDGERLKRKKKRLTFDWFFRPQGD